MGFPSENYANSSKYEFDFPPWWVIRLVRHVNHRMRSYSRNVLPRKRVGTTRQTWGDSCVSNLNKLAYRHNYPVTPEFRLSDWDACCNYQVKRWKRLNLLSAWYKKEYHVLEKMNQHIFSSDPNEKYGTVWVYCAYMESHKIRNARPCKIAKGNKYWSHTYSDNSKKLELSYILNPGSKWDIVFQAINWSVREDRDIQVTLNDVNI